MNNIEKLLKKIQDGKATAKELDTVRKLIKAAKKATKPK